MIGKDWLEKGDAGDKDEEIQLLEDIMGQDCFKKGKCW